MSLGDAHDLLEADNGSIRLHCRVFHLLNILCSMRPSLFAHILRLAGETEAARLNRCLASHGADHYMAATCEVNYEQLQSPPVWGAAPVCSCLFCSFS